VALRSDARHGGRGQHDVLRITNNSTAVIDTHLLVVLQGLPRDARLLNASGTTKAGEPYLRVFLPEGELAPGRSLNGQLVDIAPTVLAMFGLPALPHMEGSPLPPVAGRCRLDPASKPLNGPHPTPTAPQPAFEYSAEEEAILERRLADLGYLE